MMEVRRGQPPRALQTETPDVEMSFAALGITPDAHFAALRERCPVALQAGTGTNGAARAAWVLTRYEDIVAAANDPETFGQSQRFPGQRRPPLESNPPEHRIWRRLLQPHFLPKAMNRMEPFTRKLARDLLSPMLAAGSGDSAHGIARPLPPQVLLRWLGQPPQDWEMIKLACEHAYFQGSPDPAERASFEAAEALLWRYARDTVSSRIEGGGTTGTDDPVSAMVAAMATEPAVTEPLIEGVVRLVLAAGHDSTTSALGMCIGFVAGDEPLQQSLRSDPTRIPAAIEEMLRLRTPVLQMPRTVMADTVFGGRELAAGDSVLLAFASGNRDASAFENAECFDMDRRSGQHIAFGIGIHRCIGNILARQEIRVVLEELLAATQSFRPDGEIEHEFWHPYGLRRLPLSLVPR
jgi:cytochrome P450